MSGSHHTGKSSLIAAFVERLPEYVHEPEAYETIADDVPLTFSDGPTLGVTLLRYTMDLVATYQAGACVVFERSPVDYIAYAASGVAALEGSSTSEFVEAYLPAVRASVRNLDLIALLPVSIGGPVAHRAGDADLLRRRVDTTLRRALMHDDYDLFGDGPSPIVVELSPMLKVQLAELIRHTSAEGNVHCS